MNAAAGAGRRSSRDPCNPHGERVLFNVTDTGIGMTPEELGRLVQPFSQGRSLDSRKYGGSGLGLAICKEVVTLLVGSIRVDSIEGSGSSF